MEILLIMLRAGTDSAKISKKFKMRFFFWAKDILSSILFNLVCKKNVICQHRVCLLGGGR